MIIKSKLTQEDLADIVHLYDELKDLEPALNKSLIQTNVQDVIDLRLTTKSAIKLLEGVLEYKEQDNKEDKPIKDAEGNTYIVCSSYTYFGKALKRLLSDVDEGEEDCSCDLVKELIDENEHLKNRVHNLNEYVFFLFGLLNSDERKVVEDRFSGMPGYTAYEDFNFAKGDPRCQW